MISLYAGNVHFTDNIQAFLGIGVITDHITEAREVGAPLLLDILQNDLKRVQISVNIGNYSKLHVPFTLRFETRETHFAHRPNSLLLSV